MKQKHLALFLSALFVVLTSFGVYMNKHYSPSKSYTVTLSLDQWQNIYSGLDSSRRLIIKSDLPTKETLWPLQQLINATTCIQQQLQGQLLTEQEEQRKKDSTEAAKKPVTNKH